MTGRTITAAVMRLSPGGHLPAPKAAKATQRTSYEAGERSLLQLNDGWRIAHDGELQWILERRCSKPGEPARWTGRRFHTERDALLRSIRELCGTVAPAAAETIRAWPALYRSDAFAIAGQTGRGHA